jgi:glycosyltransferase involved in cell wall biosynthesis
MKNNIKITPEKTLKKKINLSIIIPCYNEEKNLLQTINKLLSILQKFDYYEIIIVDDGSIDQTQMIAQKIVSSNNNFTLISLKKNQGVQNALFVGAKKSKFKYFTHFPGDDSFKSQSIKKLISKTGQKDLIIGYRKNYHKITGLLRMVLSQTLILLMQILTRVKLKDFHGPFICPKICLKKKTKAKGYDGQIELLNDILYNEISILEVPIEVRIKTVSDTNVLRMSVCIKFALTLMRLFLKNIFRNK